MPENYQPQTDGPIFTVPEYTDEADGVKAFKQFADSLIDDLGGINAEADRDGQVIMYDTTTRAAHWAAGPVMKVVETLPDDSDPAYAEGDVVFVTGDDDLKGSGAGSAVVSGHNGATVQKSVSIGGDTYDLYTFTDDTRTDLSLTVDSAGLVDVLVVGGGGGGGCHFGSGGGAGGMLEVNGAYLPSGQLLVRVGQGGAGGFKHAGFNAALDGYDGMASRVGSYVAPGGGGGVTNDHTGTSHIGRPGRNGGSGSGGSGGSAGGNLAGGFAVTLLGNDGGSGRASADAGGGGGAGTVGGNAPSANTGGNGGTGAPSLITGSPVTFGGGGGGGGTNTAGTGGSGGGGNGGASSQDASDGAVNTGGGAGGSRSLDKKGGDGGSGIVIVRVKV